MKGYGVRYELTRSWFFSPEDLGFPVDGESAQEIAQELIREELDYLDFWNSVKVEEFELDDDTGEPLE